jgi:hypothetical protein
LLDDAEPQELVHHRFPDIEPQGVLAFGDSEVHGLAGIAGGQLYLHGFLIIDLVNRGHGYARGVG